MSHFNYGWVNQFLPEKKLVIFDVGAFDFRESINFKINFPESDVYAFEAYKYNCDKYGEHAKNRGVKVNNLAVSDKNDEVTFYNSTNLNGMEWTCSGSILEPSEKEGVEYHPGLNYNREGVTVDSVRLDSFCESNNIDNVDVIHMDIQGAEYYAIKGMGNKIRPKILFCETCEFESYTNSLTLKDLDDLLISMGYEIKERLEYDTLYILKD